MKRKKLVQFVQTPTEGKVAGIYVRVSRNEFVKGANGEKEARQSVLTQREKALAYAAAHGWKAQVYDGDCDLSGSLAGGEMGRPDLGRLTADIEAGRIHTVIVRDSSRLFRNNYFLKGFIAETLIPHGCNLVGWEKSIDITTARGRMVAGIEGEINEAQLSEISRLSAANREAKARTGTLATNPYAYGYRWSGKNTVAVVEEEARVVRRVFDEWLSGSSVGEICRGLVRDGHLTKKARRDWVPCQIGRLLRQPRYMGMIQYNGELLPSPFPAIIERTKWDEVQARLKNKSRPRAPNTTHLLSGLLACGRCLDREAGGEHVHSRMTCIRGQGGLRYYACQDERKEGHKVCQGANILADEAESFVKALVGSLSAERFGAMVQEANGGAKARERLARMEAAAAKAESRKARLLSAWGKGEVDEANYFALLKASDKAITEAKAALQEAQEEAHEHEAAGKAESLAVLHKWDSLDTRQRQKALAAVLPRIVVRDDRLELHLVHRATEPLVVPRLPVRLKGRAGVTKKLHLPRLEPLRGDMVQFITENYPPSSWPDLKVLYSAVGLDLPSLMAKVEARRRQNS